MKVPMMMKLCSFPSLNAIFQLVCIVLGILESAEACAISEYFCDNRKCISLDKFCNGVNDCGDGSDEPRYCSPCNRTYYGEIGGTYSIAVHRPSSRESQLPYVCQLTFAAGGNRFGDLVQLIFNSVTLGPPLNSDPHMISDSVTNPVCNEGHVTLLEPDRPSTAGHWCGQGWGQAVFFSETQRVSLTLSLFSIPVNPGTFAFDFRLSYKFLKKKESTVRYGPPARPFHRGQLLPGTFCSLIFQKCDKERCALQTPNYPGIYPRNVTCYYAIRQENAPVGHRAVIKLKQEKEHLIYVRNRLAAKKAGYPPMGGAYGVSSSGGISPGQDGPQGKIATQDVSVGEDCDNTSDYVTIYDGYTIRDPVLLRFCGGGKLPTVTSSGNEMLMVFHSAPTDYLLQNSPPTPVQGFHVDVEIKHLPIGSHSYVENHNCFFTISSFQQKRGFLTSPQHSLPDRTTCKYFLQGSPGEIVWISLLKFYIGPQHGKSGDESGGITGGSSSTSYSGQGQTGGGGSFGSSGYISSNSPDCNATFLQIWQGTFVENSGTNNATLLAHMCEDTPLKRTCEFMLSSTSSTPQRACHPEESFISKGPHMTLRLGIETSTVLRPVEFKLYYEFVDTRQDGEAFLPAYLSHQTKLNLFSAPNLPRPFVSSSSNLLLSGSKATLTGHNIVQANGMLGSEALPIGASMNVRKRSKSIAKALRQQVSPTGENPSPSSMSVDVAISGVSSFTASRLSSDTTLLTQNDQGDTEALSLEPKGTSVGEPSSFREDSRSDSFSSDLSFQALPSTSSTSRESFPISPKQSCSRIFRTQYRAIQAGSFTSPRNVFFFGRGGVRNLTCIYRFQGGPNERIRLTIDKISLDGGYCKAEVEPNIGRSICYPLLSNDTGAPGTVTEGQVQLWEVPWNDSRIMRECLCTIPTSPFVITSITSAMDLVLDVKNMKAFHDQNHFAFEGRYEFIKQPDCPRPQKLRTAGGEIVLRVPEKYPHKSCEHFPWEIDPQSPSHFIFLTIPGRTMKRFPRPRRNANSYDQPTQEHCTNRNRVLVYSGGPNGRLLQVVCPEDDGSSTNRVQIFSEGWSTTSLPNFAENPHQDWGNFASSNQLIVELVSRGSGSQGEYTLKWLQVSRKDEPLAVNYHYGIPGSIGILSELSPDGITKIVTPLDNQGGGKGGGLIGAGSIATAGTGGTSQSIGGPSQGSGTSSSITEELEDDVCFKFKCPELNACISPTLFCDGIEHCPSGHDESDCEYFPIPRTYLYIAAGSLIAIVVLSCCFGCLFWKRKRDERREKLLVMSSRTPTEEMFYGGGPSHVPVPKGSHNLHHREIVC